MDSPLQTLLDDLLQDRSLRDPDQLRRRIDALEQLESWLFNRGDTLTPSLRERGEALTAELEAINDRLYQTIRDAIRHGNGADILRTWAASPHSVADQESYGPLDTLIAGVLDFKEPGDVPEPGADMVFYQPTPARDIFDFIERASITSRDVMMDLGAGLGHVTLLTAICTGARCIGIELQPAYVASARQCAGELQIRHAQFIEQDVRQADLSEGTVFYLYTPFTGGILREVLDVLKRESKDRAIRVCTLGPCTAIVANEPWLKADGACDARRTTLFRSL
ncbi:class I SAM-dependent methyltransferase [Dyella humi]|uniref:Methyltransferase domain-containing protein n=1 Tax=Dyella humi TaxID=1770547 RepID=A0ABW8ILF3_9GAMM